MSTERSSVYKLGFVVRDMNEAIACYGEIYKVRKWYRILKEPSGEQYMGGELYDDENAEIILGFCGKTEIELITTTDPGNAFSAFLQANGSGLHRLSFLVRSLEDAVEEYKLMGFEILKKSFSSPGRGLRYRRAFMSRPGEEGGRVMELVEMKLGGMSVMTPRRSMLARIMSGSLERVECTATARSASGSRR